MISLEQAQIFFYISIPLILALFLLTTMFIKISLWSKAKKILNKIENGIEEIEEKIKLFKTTIEELKKKFADMQFYAEKAEEFTDSISKIKKGIKETFTEEELSQKTKKKQSQKAKTNKKSSK